MFQYSRRLRAKDDNTIWFVVIRQLASVTGMWLPPFDQLTRVIRQPVLPLETELPLALLATGSLTPWSQLSQGEFEADDHTPSREAATRACNWRFGINQCLVS